MFSYFGVRGVFDEALNVPDSDFSERNIYEVFMDALDVENPVSDEERFLPVFAFSPRFEGRHGAENFEIS